MAFLRKINSKAKAEINTGFGTNNAAYGGRFINKDGLPCRQTNEDIVDAVVDDWDFLVLNAGHFINDAARADSLNVEQYTLPGVD